MRGGISKFSSYLQNHISSYTSVFTYNYKKLYPDILFPGESQFEPRYNANQLAGLVHPYNPLNWRPSARQINKRNPDVFIFSHWHPFFIPSTLSIIRYLRKHNPEILTTGIFHNVVPHEQFPLTRVLTGRLFRNTDIPVLLSSQTYNQTSELAPEKSPTQLFHPVYERADPETDRQQIRQRYGVHKDETLFLFYGLIRHYKGLDLFFHALNELDLPGNKIKVIVAGEFYTREEQLIGMIDDSIRPHIHIENRFLSDRESDELLYAADVMVAPYRAASQSGILADAVNFKLPVICSDQPGFTDIITHRKHGWIFPSENTEALKEAILGMNDTSLRSEMITQLTTLKKQLSWKNFSEQLYSVLAERYKKLKAEY